MTAVAEQGLMGDHGCSAGCEPERQVTLIEEESLAASSAAYDVSLTHCESRRNLLTRGVPLNHLVGREFRIGEVVLRGVELCEPCGHLRKLLDRDVVRSLSHRGGLRAAVVRGGELRLGDPIEPQ